MGSNSTPTRDLTSVVAMGHGVYYVVTGVWPLVSMRTFEMISGPKREHWLVRTAGLLIGVIGLALSLAGLKRRHPPEIPILGVGSAASLAGIDLVYGLRGRISRIYVVEGVLELLLVASWGLAVVVDRRRTSE